MELKIGCSKEKDSFKAGEEAAEKTGGDGKLAYVFSSTKHDLKKILEGVNSKLSEGTPVIGCSSSVEISDQGPSTGSIVVALVKGDVNVGIGKSENASKNSYEAGKKAIKEAAENLESFEVSENSIEVPEKSLETTMINIFADPLECTGVDILEGVNNMIPDGMKVAGEFAADDLAFEDTYVFFGDEVLQGTVVTAILETKVPVEVSARHGFEKTPQEYTVTDAEGVDVFKLDERPPKEVYSDLFGEKMSEDPGFLLMTPFGIDVGGDEKEIRVTLGVGDDGSYHCGATVPENIEVSIMKGEKDKLLDAAELSAKIAKENLDSKPSSAIIFNCVGRHAIYDDMELTAKEVERIKETLGVEQVAGVYGFGQIATTTKKARFNEETVVLQVFGR